MKSVLDAARVKFETSLITKNDVSVRPSVRSSVRPLKSTSPYGVLDVTLMRTRRILMVFYIFLRIKSTFPFLVRTRFYTQFEKFMTFTDRVIFWAAVA